MKLYTEEQIKEIYRVAWWNGYEDVTGEEDYTINLLTPIELPSDEEIEKETNSDVSIENDESFRDGAKWMRDKILNK